VTVLRYIVYIVTILACTIPCFGQIKPFTIAESGVARVAIVLSVDATIPEQTAAKELAGYLKQITGSSFKIYSPDSAPKGMARIIVGQSGESQKLLENIDWKKLKFDGIIIKFVGNDLILAGDRPRGSLYAVYTFLEDYLGCRWWTVDSSYIPSKPSLSVNRINKTHIPPFMYRDTYFQSVLRQNMEFASRLKLNGHYEPVPPEYGGHYSLIGFVHTFDELLPASRYIQDHPDWYSLIDGKRVGGQSSGQLCLTNEEMKAEFIKQALKAIEKDPAAGMISISQNDNISYCQCDKCMAIAKEEGSQSGPVIRFVNSVADEIAKKYPDFLVETLAYLHTRHAPKLVKPRDNVIVRLCSIESDFAKPLNSKSNAAFYKDLQDWKKISKRLYVWDYVVNFGDLTIAHPNWHVLAPNIRTFAANNVVGLFEQGDGFNKDAAFAHMKLWVLSHLEWDATLDSKQLMQTFAKCYYGPAASYLLKYIDLTCKAVERTNTNLLCSIGSTVNYLSQNDMDKSTELFDQAERSVSGNPELLNRVRIERLALDHTWILQTQLDRAKAGKTRGMDMKSMCEHFITMSETTRNNFLGENWLMSAEYNKGLRLYASVPYVSPAKRSAMYPAAVRGLKADQWVEMQDSKINMFRPGSRSFITADPDASDGITIRMPGNINDWAAQMFLDKTGIQPGTKVDLYMSIKVDAKSSTGTAFTTGVYDDIKQKRILDKTIMLQDVKDNKYHDYKLGTFTLEPGWFVYVAPPGDENVDNVYVDRGFVIKAKKE